MDLNFPDLVDRINLLSDLLASSSSHELMRNIDAKDLRNLWKFLENIATTRDSETHLLSISLRASMLLLVFLKAKHLDPPGVGFLPILLKKVLVNGNLYWLEDTPMLDKFVWSVCIFSSLETILK